MKMDDETGLPVIPEGFYWEVREVHNYLDGDYPLTVTLIDNRASDFPLRVGSAYARAYQYSVRDAAKEVFKTMRKQLAQEKNVETLVGNYPPKRL